jgi:hypothetical protein
MKKINEHIIYKTLSEIISEQAPAEGPSLETDNAESDDDLSLIHI